VGEEKKTNEDCVEAVWEKRRMREKRWCTRSKIPDGVEGIRFLLGFVLGVQSVRWFSLGCRTFYCVFSFFVTFLLWTKLEIYKVLGVQEKGFGVQGEAPMYFSQWVTYSSAWPTLHYHLICDYLF